MTAHVRILTTKTVDSSPAILLVGPDGSKTLVNCGEGCQRSFLEHSQKLSTVNRVCLTHIAHDSVGGLPGMILTSADAAKAAQMDAMAASAGVPAPPSDKHSQQKGKRQNNNNNTLTLPGLELIGPGGTQKYVRSLRHFMRRDEFPIRIREGSYHHAPASSQEELSQKQRAKKKRKRQESKTSNGNSTSEDQQGPDHFFGVQAIPIPYQIPIPDTTSSTTGKDRRVTEVSSFLFTTPPVSGKFLPEKAKELGIPPGPLYAQLKVGKDVTFEDAQGTQHHVKSSEVVLEPTPGIVVAILYYPTLDVWTKLQPLVETSIQDQNKSKNTVKLELAVHIAPKEVFGASECKAWRQLQHTNGVQHLWMESSDVALWRPSSCHSRSPFTSACVGALVRSQICSDLYKKPDYLDGANDAKSSTLNPLELEEDSNTRPAEAMLEYVVMPRSRKGYVELAKDYLETTRQEGLTFATKSGALDHGKEILQTISTVQTEAANGNNKCKAQLLFTGTGSAMPCKHRNVTGMCLRMEDGQAILLDVGEGTVGQLLRASSTLVDDDAKDESDSLTYEHLLRNIKAAWVSHPHADHHLGLLRLLTDRQAILHHHSIADNDNDKNDRLVVIGPPPILDFLREYVEVDPRIASSYIGLDCRELQNNPERPRTSMPRVMQENSLLGGRITSMEAIPVAHCAYSYAVILEGTTFGKVAYSGDCRPSRKFAHAALNADLLIHEATFENGMEAEATMKRHSTVGEALSIAHQMKAKQLVLTHFSQRYPKIPPVGGNSTSTERNNGGTKTTNSTTDTEMDIPVIFAFDFMAITPTNLREASHITPALRLLYPEADSGDGNDEIVLEDPAAMSIPGFFAQDIH